MFWTRLQPRHGMSTLSNPYELVNRFMNASSAGQRRAPDFPAFNLWATDAGAVLTSEVPGVKLEELDISVSGRNVTVKGSRKTEESAEKATHLRRERSTGGFERTFELPYAIEAGRVEASFKNGVLTISLPHAENEKPRKIAISG